MDVYPGDRAASCGALMEPAAYSVKAGEERILQRCVGCGHERENRIDGRDDRNAIVRVARAAAERLSKEGERLGGSQSAD